MAAGRRNRIALEIVGRNRTRHVGVDAEQFRRRLLRPCTSVTIAPQSPPCATNFVVAQPLHQHDPGASRCALGSQPVVVGRCRESVARHRRNHDVEGVGGRSRRVPSGSVERLDDLHLLDDRTGPPVRDDDRQRVLVLRAHVDEVNVEPIDLGDELRERVQLRLAACASRSRSPSSARAPASARAARLANHRTRFPAQATSLP